MKKILYLVIVNLLLISTNIYAQKDQETADTTLSKVAGNAKAATDTTIKNEVVAMKADSDYVEMADKMRADGKIWVVIAVITVVFVGIIAYLVLLDRKISKIEKGL